MPNSPLIPFSHSFSTLQGEPRRNFHFLPPFTTISGCVPSVENAHKCNNYGQDYLRPQSPPSLHSPSCSSSLLGGHYIGLIENRLMAFLCPMKHLLNLPWSIFTLKFNQLIADLNFGIAWFQPSSYFLPQSLPTFYTLAPSLFWSKISITPTSLQ